MKDIKVLYEDNHIIAVLKPSGVLTQSDGSGDVSLFDEVKNYLKEKYQKPGNVFLGLVHRLDKPVTGIVLFAKTSKGASRLSEQFREHTIQKTYHAIVLGKLKNEKGDLKEKINKISFFAEGFTNKTDEELLAEIKKATKTRTAELSYEVVKSNGKFSLLKILPKTGRFHQIRVQMAEMGNPILGDRKYSQTNMPDWKDNSAIALCATDIEFKLATKDEIKKISIDLPESWQKYL
ncbi:MAG: hypothetical protein A2360_04740 [Candidatus Staskawiczbacteria bacterium RIFOXYB1_FULL_32_11]|uniref:Pseudouridine synthase RsuA/RluA-like domain-containing protein n=1 Tax=Candidatus Staskawiczbacteria bacterium RIFOXYD1_FULL_32_13 TaxID=1802234 RepID=A0A1G2JJY3_9BACT|nr:MAG: pseudouridine synthase [Parcubacteria group bacterium GW2011_GWC2_32_10]OGZ79543.1 MAG: hypothetical protein A2360_04740 [Candidatus Staskawiczbacteria bacterium RIFOXYB1_FULL_32_11]OGZ80867.1 MAG: hypothetical protein A2256_00090 [Candidatus Staskawiczbacteria bacterium RIFOXYA2_FULL_32_7]OGZ86097.1 MAG: hypothetical protein A2463_01285 [Candidatus Staskawiczbacteria bacterium RIFOXYC2_FULL_32_10]OGZ87446.1 MAG: hypothetical protein A2561_04245 [Candidatus Staskawiczbacteria bacterium 